MTSEPLREEINGLAQDRDDGPRVDAQDAPTPLTADEALAEFICPYDMPMGLRVLAQLTPEKRAVYERMAEVCDEIDLWQAGVGPKPLGVILCGPRQVRGAGARKEKPERKVLAP